MTSIERLEAFRSGDERMFFNMDMFEHSALYFLWLAIEAGEKFRKTGDAGAIISGIKTWLIGTGISKTQANAVLRIVANEMALKGSVLRNG